jgi:hypothetical protein
VILLVLTRKNLPGLLSGRPLCSGSLHPRLPYCLFRLKSFTVGFFIGARFLSGDRADKNFVRPAFPAVAVKLAIDYFT